MSGPLVPLEKHELVVPGTGEVIDLEDEIACCRALHDLNRMEQMIRTAKRELAYAITERSRVLGTKTITLPSGEKAQVGSDRETVYDAQAIEEGLRAAGMPEQRIQEIIETTVTTRVRAVEAKRAAAANPEYARVIETNRREHEKTPSVSFRR